MHYNILSYASIEVLMQLTYYCRLYEASPYNMQIDRATFIALSLVKPKGLSTNQFYLFDGSTESWYYSLFISAFCCRVIRVNFSSLFLLKCGGMLIFIDCRVLHNFFLGAPGMLHVDVQVSQYSQYSTT